MPQNFIECDRDQELLLPPSMREWLPEDHLAWFVLDAVEEMDLQSFYGAYRQEGWGRAAFEPKVMVALLLYAYAVGERSSRGVERRCREDVAFRVLAANQIPDHATIARFRARHEQALADTFEQVLALCARAGLVSVGLVALDGSLIAANASQGATRSYPQIRAEVEWMLEEAAETDQREDAELGEARGDELPVELGDRRSRRERLRRCKEELEAQHAAELRAHEDNLAWRKRWEAEHGRKWLVASRPLRQARPRGRSHRGDPRHARGPGALQTKTADRRAGLRQHQVHPQSRSLPATRISRLQGRMEALGRHSQPAEALAGRVGAAANRLSGTRSPSAVARDGLSRRPESNRPTPDRLPARLSRGLRDSLKSGVFAF